MNSQRQPPCVRRDESSDEDASIVQSAKARIAALSGGPNESGRDAVPPREDVPPRVEEERTTEVERELLARAESRVGGMSLEQRARNPETAAWLDEAERGGDAFEVPWNWTPK